MKKNILSVIGAATVAAVALKLTTKYVKNEVIKELEDDGERKCERTQNKSAHQTILSDRRLQ